QWYTAARNQDPAHPPDDAVRQLIERWTQVAGADMGETEGQRQQPLLRELTRWATAGGVKEMARDELDFLAAAWTLARGAKNQARFKRAAFHLAPRIAEIEARRAALPMALGMPHLSRRMAITTSE